MGAQPGPKTDFQFQVTFNFCLKELLTHLHRSATESMVFGFTSTRVTNYTPGDTFGPLKTLLAREKNAGLHLRHETTYCFDSEAFRYLAAYKSGHEMENFEDFRRSWEQSHKETQRLITHFTSKPPHRVRDMLGLNRARQLIQELTKPMADGKYTALLSFIKRASPFRTMFPLETRNLADTLEQCPKSFSKIWPRLRTRQRNSTATV